MRSISKKAAVIAAVMSVAVLSGCDYSKRFESMESRLGAVETTANNAAAAANRAQSTADSASAAAAEAQKSANDAVEAVSRMAEKCCRK